MSNSTAKYCPVIGITVDFPALFTGANFVALLNFVRLLAANSDVYNRINSELLNSSLVISSDHNLPTEI